MAQSNSRDDILKYNRSAIIIQGIERLRRNSEQALIAEALSPTAPRDSRIAAAILLIREHQSQPAIDAALEAMSLDMPAGFNEWESAGNWRLEYPVAAEAALHAGLMEKIIRRAVDGRLPESAVAFLLLSYQTENHRPRVHLDALLKINLSPEQRQRAKRLIAILKGEYLNDPPIAESVKEPTSKTPPAVVLPWVMNAETKAAASLTSHLDEEPPSLSMWGIIAALTVAAAGLLRLVFKNRRSI